MSRRERETRREKRKWRNQNRKKIAENHSANPTASQVTDLSKVPPIETISSPAHYGNGIVLCGIGGCKEFTWKFIGRVFDGYELAQLTPGMIHELQVMAAEHLKEYPKHPVRVIVFEQGMQPQGEIQVHTSNTPLV